MEKIQSDLKNLKTETKKNVQFIKKETKELQDRMENMEEYSRLENIIIKGIKKKEDETI